MRIVTVFTPRAHHMGTCEYTPKHVQALARQVEDQCVEFECLTNANIPGVKTRPVETSWPGWWQKMSLFDPELPGGFVFMDLDTVVTGTLDDILSVSKLTLLRDPYRDGKKLKEGLGSGLMYLPEDRGEVWRDWISQPQLHMRTHPRGDQFLLEKHYLNSAQRWQDAVPGQIASWKVNCKNGVVPPGVRVVVFHGQPRPWSVGQFAPLYR